MASGREPAHVGADFGDDHLRAQVAHAVDGAQLAHRITETGKVTVHLLIDLGDSFRQGIDLAQMRPRKWYRKPPAEEPRESLKTA